MRGRIRFFLPVGVVGLAVASVGVVTLDASAASAPQIAEATSESNNLSTHSAKARCPWGTVAVGGSATVNQAPAGSYHITAVWPSGRNLTVEARSFGDIGQWSVTATAVCESSRQLRRLTTDRVTAAPRDPSDSYGVADAYCADDRRLVGFGWRLTDEQSRLHTASPDQAAPPNTPSDGEYGDKPNAASVFAIVPGRDGSSETPGHADLIALCAAVTNTFFRIGYGNFDSAGHGTASVSCGAGVGLAAGLARGNPLDRPPYGNSRVSAVSVSTTGASAQASFVTDEPGVERSENGVAVFALCMR